MTIFRNYYGYYSQATDSTSTGVKVKRKRPKRRSKQKNIKKDHRPEDKVTF